MKFYAFIPRYDYIKSCKSRKRVCRSATCWGIYTKIQWAHTYVKIWMSGKNVRKINAVVFKIKLFRKAWKIQYSTYCVINCKALSATICVNFLLNLKLDDNLCISSWGKRIVEIVQNAAKHRYLLGDFYQYLLSTNTYQSISEC